MSLAGRAFVKSTLGAARFRLTGRRVPLSVSLCVTRRCDCMCLYCNAPAASEEMSSVEVISLIDELGALGCTRVVFTGAEPLLRAELPAFIDRCREHGMWTVVETNGHLLPEGVAELASVSRLMVSLDGNEPEHDAVREPGSFRRAMSGIHAARSQGIPVGTITVLTQNNVEKWEDVLLLGEQSGFSVAYQPVLSAGALATKRARKLVASDEALRRALLGVLEAKKSGRPIAMSEKTLRFLLGWERHQEPLRNESVDDLVCMAGQVSCAVDANGDVSSCTPRLGLGALGNVRNDGFLQAFSRLADNSCRACTSTSCTEANFLYNLNTPVVIEVARVGLTTLFRGIA